MSVRAESLSCEIAIIICILPAIFLPLPKPSRDLFELPMPKLKASATPECPRYSSKPRFSAKSQSGDFLAHNNGALQNPERPPCTNPCPNCKLYRPKTNFSIPKPRPNGMFPTLRCHCRNGKFNPRTVSPGSSCNEPPIEIVCPLFHRNCNECPQGPPNELGVDFRRFG